MVRHEHALVTSVFGQGKALVSRTRKRGVFLSVLAALIMAAVSTPVPGQISVTGDYDNGRIQVIDIDQENNFVHVTIPPDNHTDNRYMKYWSMRLSGIVPGEWVTLKNNYTVPNHYYCYSYDRTNWFRFPVPGIDTLSHIFTQPDVQIGPNIPYPYQHSLDLCSDLENIDWVTVSNLCTSEGGRAVKLLRITDPDTPDAGKRLVWISGRSHAFESHSSQVPDAFARWLASDDPVAVELRTMIIAYVLPIIDVDNVYEGLSGKNQPPHDHNRDYADNDPDYPPTWIAIQSLKTLVNSLIMHNTMLFFIDCHSPYYADGPDNHWYVNERTPGNWDTFRGHFFTANEEVGKSNVQPMYAKSLSSGPGSLNSRSGAGYAYAAWCTTADALSATWEISHRYEGNYGPGFMTREGLISWGEAFGRTVYKYMGGTGVPANIPPRAHLIRTGNGFDASGSTDADGHIIEYHWDFGDGAVGITTTPLTSHTFSESGFYPVSVKVKDNGGKLSAPYSITEIILPVSSPEELIIDNAGELFSQNGFTLTTSGYNNTVHYCENLDSSKYARYTPWVHGVYQVELFWESYTNKATDAPWTVFHADGSTTVHYDQNATSGWKTHGTYTLDEHSSIVLSGNANGVVVADAVRLTKISAGNQHPAASGATALPNVNVRVGKNSIHLSPAFGKTIASIHVFDFRGRLVSGTKEGPVAGLRTLDTRNIPGGIYMLRVAFLNGNSTQHAVTLPY